MITTSIRVSTNIFGSKRLSGVRVCETVSLILFWSLVPRLLDIQKLYYDHFYISENVPIIARLSVHLPLSSSKYLIR